MKMRLLISVTLAAELFASGLCPAQGTIMSNLGLTPTGSLGVGSDSWIAQQFFSEYNANNTSAYVVTSVQLLMDPGSGNPGGFTVSIYSGSSGPQKDLGALSGPDPSAGGLFTYTSSGITLLPYNNINPPTDYFIVVTGATPVGQGAYAWSAESGHGDTVGNNNWFMTMFITRRSTA